MLVNNAEEKTAPVKPINILVLMLTYPDSDKELAFYPSLIRELPKHGINITLVAPSVNGFIGMRQTHPNIRELRVKTGKLFNTNPIRKGINNVLLPYQFWRAIQEHLENVEFDWVLSPTPPITFYPVIKKIKKLKQCKSYLILRDIFPQNAVDLNILKNRAAIRYFENQERKLYEVSDVIGCMSDANINYVKTHHPNLDNNKLTYLQNWIAPPIKSSVNRNAVREKLGLSNSHFLVLFGGNFGVPQNVDAILDLAESALKSLNNVRFVLIGGGTETNRMKKTVSLRKLTNVLILERVKHHEYMQIAQSCDIGLVSLSPLFTIPNIPSRALSYWASGLPVLASLDKSTDIGDIIDEVQGGMHAHADDPDKLLKQLIHMHKNNEELLQMAQRGLDAITTTYSTTVVAEILFNQLQQHDIQQT